MSQTIQVSENVFSLLDEEARCRISPSELADRLLAEQLGAESAAWRAQFAELLARGVRVVSVRQFPGRADAGNL